MPAFYEMSFLNGSGEDGPPMAANENSAWCGTYDFSCVLAFRLSLDFGLALPLDFGMVRYMPLAHPAHY